MLLRTLDDFGKAKRTSEPVMVFTVDGDGNKVFDGYGIIIDFSDTTLSILSNSVGVLHFLRENIEVKTARSVKVRIGTLPRRRRPK